MKYLLALVLATSAHAYVTYGVAWKKNELAYAFENTPAFAQAAFKESFASWTRDAFRGGVRFVEKNPPDIIIRWSTAPVIVGGQYVNAVTTLDSAGGSIKSALIIVEGARIDWTKPTPSGATIQSVSLHEIGHALGLGHSDRQYAVMAPYAVARALQSDDIKGIASLYTVPESEYAKFIGAILNMGQSYQFMPQTSRNIPPALLKRANGNGFIIVKIESDTFYFDAVLEIYIGVLPAGKAFKFK